MFSGCLQLGDLENGRTDVRETPAAFAISVYPSPKALNLAICSVVAALISRGPPGFPCPGPGLASGLPRRSHCALSFPSPKTTALITHGNLPMAVFTALSGASGARS